VCVEIIARFRSIPTPSDVPVNCCRTTLSARHIALAHCCAAGQWLSTFAAITSCNQIMQQMLLWCSEYVECTFTNGFRVIFFRYDSICRLRSDPLPTNKTLLQEVIVIAIFAPAQLLIDARCCQSKSPALVSRWLPGTLCRTTISITSSSC
jgi:hypothetical protein